MEKLRKILADLREKFSGLDRLNGVFANISIGKKLIAAFFSVALLTVLVSGISWFSIGALSDQEHELTQRNIPEITSTLKLANDIGQLAAAAPLLNAASNDEERTNQYNELVAGIETARGWIDQLKDLNGEAESILELEQELDAIVPVFDQLNSTVADNFGHGAKVSDLLTQLADLREVSKAVTDPLIQDVNFVLLENKDAWVDKVYEGVDGALDTGEEPELDFSEIENVATTQLKFVESVLRFQSGVSLLVGILLEVGTEDDFERVTALGNTFRTNLASIAKPYTELKSLVNSEDLDRVFNTLLEIGIKGDENTNIFKVKEIQIASIQKSQDLLTQIRDVSVRLGDAAKAAVVVTEDGIAASVEKNEANIANVKFILIAITAASLVFAGLIGWLYVARSLIRRLMTLVGSMQSIADGNLQTSINRNGEDEISQMAKALAVLRNISREAEELKAKQEEDRIKAEEEKRQATMALANDFDQSVGASINVLSENATGVKHRAEEMQSIARKTQNETIEISSASGIMSGDIATVAASAEELSSSIVEISQQVAKSSQVSKNAVDRSQDMTTNIDKLKDGSEKIEEVIGLINNIASQTNLLALNATIEAARAGDAGKGFAVVANEVKNLATQTTGATEDISALISNIQLEIGGTVDAASEINTIINDIDHIFTEIAAAVEEQGAATQEISRTVNQTATNCNMIADRVQDVSSALGQVDEVMTTVVMESGENSNQSQMLRSNVEDFLDGIRKG